MPYPNSSGVLDRGRHRRHRPGRHHHGARRQDLDVLWKINVGTGFNAPPMTYSVNGKQYIAIASGLFGTSRREADKIPELKNQANATMLFVFGL